MPINIVIPDDYQSATDAIDFLHSDPRFKVQRLTSASGEGAAQALAEADALILIRERTRVDAAFLGQAPRLKLISQTGKVARNIDLPACQAAGIAISEGVGSPIAPAELAWLLIMASRRKLVAAVNAMAEGRWQTNIGTAVHGQTLGILGFGNIGKRVAGFGKAFGMDVVICGSDRALGEAAALGYRTAASREAFFAECDVISLHQRLLPATAGNVRHADLARMKASALFVNTSRAELVEPGALLRALQQGRPGFAALDVFENEPVGADEPLLQLPNVLCTPHLGYVETGTYELYFRSAFDNVVKFFDGERSHLYRFD